MTGQPGAGRQLPSAETAEAVRAVVLAVPGVAGLHAGAFGEAATHFAGRSVKGIQLRPDSTTVHVVLGWDAPADETAARVRSAVSAVTHTSVDVVVEDVAFPPGMTDQAQT